MYLSLTERVPLKILKVYDLSSGGTDPGPAKTLRVTPQLISLLIILVEGVSYTCGVLLSEFIYEMLTQESLECSGVGSGLPATFQCICSIHSITY